MTDEELDALENNLAVRGKQDREMSNHYVHRMEVDRVAAKSAITTLRAQLAETRAERDAWRDQCRDPLLGSFAKALEDHRESIPVAIWSHIDALQKQIDYSANGKYGPVYSGPMVDAAFARAEAAEAQIAALTARVEGLTGALQSAHEALLWCARDGRMASPLLHQYPAKWAEEARAALSATTEEGHE